MNLGHRFSELQLQRVALETKLLIGKKKTELESKLESEPESDSDSKVESEPISDLDLEPKSVLKSEPESESDTEAESESESEPESEPQSETQSETQSEPQSKPQSEPQSKPKSKPQTEPETAPEETKGSARKGDSEQSISRTETAGDAPARGGPVGSVFRSNQRGEGGRHGRAGGCQHGVLPTCLPLLAQAPQPEVRSSLGARCVKR